MTTQHINLKPGEVFFGQGDIRVDTLLGSCVSIVLWHPEQRYGGICHYVLPTRRKEKTQLLDGRYGDEAFALLLTHIGQYEPPLLEYEAKVFGGAQSLDIVHSTPHVGTTNWEFGLALLEAHGVHVVGRHLAGRGYRLLQFSLLTGEVLIRHRNSNALSPETNQKTKRGR